jgi:tetratricopeptide (TPR) repeat protein
MRPHALVALVLCLVLAACAAQAREPDGAEEGPRLQWVEFSLGGKPVRVNAGGVLSIHPDAPFMVSEVQTDSWLELGVKVRLGSLPGVDLGRFHTLSELLGEGVFEAPQLKVLAVMEGRVLGWVGLQVSLLPIDWLRRARQTEDPDRKIEYLRKARELTPDDELLAGRLVDLLIEARRYQEAAEVLERESLHRSTDKSLRQLAELYQRMGQPRRAAAALSKLLASHPRDRQLIQRLAGLYQELERWGEAATLLDRLLTLQPRAQRGDTYLRLARVLSKAGKPQEARAAMEAAGELRPADADLWLRLAEARREAGDRAGALAALKRAVELRPGEPELRLELAQAYLAAGEKRLAAEQIAEAAAARPGEAALWMRLARLYQELDEPEKLAEVYERLVKLRPDDADLLFNLAVLNLELERLDKALRYFRAAQKLKPKDQEIRRAVLDVLLQMGQWEQAAEVARRIIQENPEDTEIIGVLYPSLSQHAPDRLAGLMDLILEQRPAQPKLYQLRAALALDADDQEAAVRALEQGVEAAPDNVDLWWDLAGLYEAAGRTQKALDALARVLELNPEHPGAEERYLELKTSTLGAKTGGAP